MSPTAETLEGRTRVLIERVLDSGARFRRLPRAVVEVAQEGLRRHPPRLLPGRAPNGTVRGDHRYLLLRAVLGGEALDQRVRLLREADDELPVGRVLPDPVENDDSPG